MSSSQSRVLVWLEPTATREASLQVLEGLAADTRPEILGLYVEDVNLLNMATLSVAREITFGGAAARQPERESIEKQFRTQAARMRALFEKVVRAVNARHSFRITRGELRAELLKTAREYDTLVLAHSRHEIAARLSTRPHLGELVASGPRTIVVVQERWRTGHSVGVVFDGTPQSETALRTAAALAASERLDLAVWLSRKASDDSEAHAEEILGDSAAARFRTIDADDIEAVVAASVADGVRALVLPSGNLKAMGEMVPALLDRLSCSLILVR